MITKEKYLVNLLGGFVDFNTLSENQKYYFKIKKPFEISFGVFASDLAFFDTYNNEIIYCNEKGSPVSFLPPYDTFNNVCWLANNYVLFIEYSKIQYTLCLLNLNNHICFKKIIFNGDELNLNVQTLINNQFQITFEYIKEQGFEEFIISKKYLKKNYSSSFFSKWYPSIK